MRNFDVRQRRCGGTRTLRARGRQEENTSGQKTDGDPGGDHELISCGS
jgi:hypothetical protein